jgi:hypothetical protein
MKIKLNWGKGLILGMGAFMLYIVVMGVYMFRQSPDDFDRQYYEKGLAYDSVYNQEKQVFADKVQPKIKFDRNNLSVNFIKPANGSVQFQRLADPGLDKLIAFKSDSGNVVNIPLNSFSQGRWDLTFSWKSGEKKYRYQQKINLQ